MRHVHFIGIGGVGMSGLAHVLLARGESVSGSDPHHNAATERLAARGATLYTRQSAENIDASRPDLVVATAAIQESNEELLRAREAGIPVVSRAEFLGVLMAEAAPPRVAIAGTHGKTTTTAMVAEILIAGGLDPTVLVGGEYAPIGGNVRIGAGAFLTEACEAYDSFLALHPDVSVITNVEADHLDHYGTEEAVVAGFERFARQTSPGGCIVWCADDEGARRLDRRLGASGAAPRRIAYGLEPHCGEAVWAASVEPTGAGSRFEVWRRSAGEDVGLGSACIRVPGRHNVLNALAACAVGAWLGMPFDRIADGLAAFRGTGRRFEPLGEAEGALVVDDYAHHPTEIRATVAAVRDGYPGRRLVVVFQPHLYSRTRDFMDGFAAALAEADAVILTDIYAAREQPIPGVRVPDLVRRISEIAPEKSVMYVPVLSDVAARLRWLVHAGDVVVTMGAGDVRDAGEQFLRDAARKEGRRDE